MKKYNGHSSWNAWNTSLWLSNDYIHYGFSSVWNNTLDVRGNIMWFIRRN